MILLHVPKPPHHPQGFLRMVQLQAN